MNIKDIILIPKNELCIKYKKQRIKNKKLKGLLIDILNTCNDLDIKIDELKEIKNVLHVD